MYCGASVICRLAKTCIHVIHVSPSEATIRDGQCVSSSVVINLFLVLLYLLSLLLMGNLLDMKMATKEGPCKFTECN